MATKFYHPELDVLRFVAFSFVFLFHTAASIRDEMYNKGGFEAILSNLAMTGSYGVDIFFLLSAYLITSLLLREMDRSGTIDTGAFYARRILRIWPLYFFFLLFTLILSRFTSVQFPNKAIVPMFLFYGNFWIMANTFFSPAGILWSVSVEEQFYLFSPLVTRFISRRGLVGLASMLILIAIVARFVLVKSAIANPDTLWFCTLARLDPIATGILVCLLLNGRVLALRSVTRAALLVAGAICLYGAAVWLHGADQDVSLTEVMFAYPLADVGALAIFLSFFGSQIAWGPLIYLGQISYGLYVYHLFALDVAKVGLLHFMGECPFWFRGAIGLPITIGMAAASYAWLEAPFLRLKGRFSPTESRNVSRLPESRAPRG
jgi:peptidoglycan/LPS O-acetylase OafA/YrhL